MRKYFCLLIIIIATAICASAHSLKLIIAPGSLSANSATLIWDKPHDYRDIKAYHIIVNGKDAATALKCNFILNSLSSSTKYQCIIRAEYKAAGKFSTIGNKVKFTTKAQGKTLDITAFGAKGDSATINTLFIQKAIDACPENGTVLIPKGKFISGALFLKSHMTLEIVKGATLQGSINETDYQPFINNRFEGWEMKTYASLINAGVMNHNGGYTTEDISIKGEGTISGGGKALAKAMIDKAGMRGRGRLICLMNCSNVELQGLTIENSPCWTIQYIYSKGVSCHDLKIISTVTNGDGLDPDSSDDSYIFNCSFSTGDDCIAIKSGKNPEGYTIGKPTRNVNITDCDFIKGHGISIGSEMSGGVSDVLVRDCKAGPLLHGLQIKGTKDRGGYVKNVTVADCQLQQITIFSAVNYNNDGAPAPVLPTFENFIFKGIDLSGAPVKEPVIDINGFDDPSHLLKNVSFKDIKLPQNAKVNIKNAGKVNFTNVKTEQGDAPQYVVTGSKDVHY